MPRKSKIISRRKRLCKDWFNDDWAKKVIGLMLFIGEDGKILIGDPNEDTIIINSRPCTWDSASKHNEKALIHDSAAIAEGLMEPPESDEEYAGNGNIEKDKLIVLDEPTLQFAQGQDAIDPHDGLTLFDLLALISHPTLNHPLTL
ncbi:MAG: hypothetical protein ACOX2W_12865 [Desulfomonilia bacterium]